MMIRLELEGSDKIDEGLAAVVHGFYQRATKSLSSKVELAVYPLQTVSRARA